MKTALVFPIGLVCAGLGAVVALAMFGSVESDGSEGSDEVLVVSDEGSRSYTATEAAARIERLEAMVRRRTVREQRGEARESSLSEAEEAEALAAFAALGDGGPRLPEHPDGRAYTVTEIIELALTSADPQLRRAAIRRLRRVNTPQARETLEALLKDERTPPEMRLEAASALSRPPHRDKVTENLVNLLAAEDDPAVKGMLAIGVSRLRARGAWMSEISALLADETDPAARKELLRAITRSARDPAAQQQLLSLALSESASLEERQRAIQALSRGRTNADLVAAAGPLFKENDPLLRRDALRILAGARKLPPATLRAGLADDDPRVREIALQNGLKHLRGMQRDKKLPKETVRAIVDRTVELARSDPDADVRRTAIQRSYLLPKKDREGMLTTARSDTDDFVRLSAYAASPRKVAKQARDQYVTALNSDNANLRGFAYRQLQRLYGVKTPYNSRWNPQARERAANDILGQLSQKP